MDGIVKRLAGFGVPAIVLLVTIEMMGYAGAVAITSALSALGPGGMLGGIATLGIIGLATEAITEYGFDAIATGVVKEWYRSGITKDEVFNKINKLFISKKLKARLFEVINAVD